MHLQTFISLLILIAVSLTGTALGDWVVCSLSVEKLNTLIGFVILLSAGVVIIQRTFFGV